MRLIALSLMAAWLATSASGEDAPDEMASIHASGHWSGCVFQQGFDPYPIRISPRPAPTLKVEYPGLCTGYHTPRQEGWPNDAVEVITKDKGTCIKTVDLDYSFEDGLLRIDYQLDGDPYALLMPVDPSAETLSCDRGEVSS